MKQRPEIGQQFLLKTTLRSGIMVESHGDNDGPRMPGVWPVFRIFTGGRGWSSFLYYALLDKHPLPLKVKVIEPAAYEKDYNISRKLVEVQFVGRPAVNQSCERFSLKPYVRRNGETAPNITVSDFVRSRKAKLCEGYGMGGWLEKTGQPRASVALADLLPFSSK